MVRGKTKDMRRALARRMAPNMNLLKAIGSQMVEGFKGGMMLTGAKVNNNGTVTHTNGRYPRGILRGVSPDGRPYADLSKRTISLKRQEGSRYATQPLRFRNYGDPDALVNSVGYRIYKNRNSVEVLFKSSEMNERSKFHEEGAEGIDSPTFTKKGKGEPIKVDVPARPHRDIQPQVQNVIRRLLKAWADRKQV